MAFIKGMNKARCLSHPLEQITVTADANKEEGNVAFVRKDERGEQRGEEKTITGSERVRLRETDKQIFPACNVWRTSSTAGFVKWAY